MFAGKNEIAALSIEVGDSTVFLSAVYRSFNFATKFGALIKAGLPTVDVAVAVIAPARVGIRLRRRALSTDSTQGKVVILQRVRL